MRRVLGTSALITGIIAGVVVLAAAQERQQAKTSQSNGMVNVTTTIHDTDSSGVALLQRSDDHNGTGEATYRASDTNVMSFIDSSGEWFLNLYGQTTRQLVIRQMWVTPNDIYSSNASSVPPEGFYWQNVEISSVCRDQSGNTVPFANVVTSSGNCSLDFDFGYKGVVYKLLMSPVLRNATDPETGLVTVTCNSLNGARCVSWTVAPNTSAGAPNPTIADLYSYAGGAKHPWVFLGQYYDTFRIDVTDP